MGLTQIVCCGETFSIAEALEHVAHRRNRCQWTYELIAAMVAGHESHPSNDDPTRISTTVLTSKCLRNTTLQRFNDYSEAPEDLWASFRGTMFHKQLEQWAQPRSYGEARFFVADMGTKIEAIKKALPRKDRSFSGSPDLVDPVAGMLYDYKRTKEVPRFNSVWPDHAAQLNINRWLVDNADTVSIADEFVALSHALVGMDGDAFIYDMTDPAVRERFVPFEWQELIIVYVDDKGPKPIVVTESIDVPTKAGGTKKARVPAFWTEEVCENYIAERYVAARLAFLSATAPIPVGWEHQSHVLCGYCPVRDMCADLERLGE